MDKSVVVLGIESSCDDTAVAILRCSNTGLPEVLSSVVYNQDNLHERFGGVVPEIAARAHVDRLDYCTEEALAKADLKLRNIDIIAVTAGPGLIGGVLSGVCFAKGLASATDKPLIGVNHLAGHALTARMTHSIGFPYLSLLVSGGHCQFLAVFAATKFIRLGGTLDDAPGEAFDKSARLLGLNQPGGPAIEKAAVNGRADRFAFPRPLIGKPGCNMSFSGLKTALLRACNALKEDNDKLTNTDITDLCACFQKAVNDSLVSKAIVAINAFKERAGKRPAVFAVSGGVAANQTIRTNLDEICRYRGIQFIAPPLYYCTDNGAIIAWAGYERWRLGMIDGASLQARSRWPLDITSPPLAGYGKRGVKS